MEKRILIAGSGGQGILFSGKLLTYAAMLEEKEVTCFPAYGAEIRGGTANCTVTISDQMIGSPVARIAHVLIVMNEASYDRFSDRLAKGGLLIYDSSLITPKNQRLDITLVPVPAYSLSVTHGNTKSANMVMMGAAVAASNFLTIDSVIHALNDMTTSQTKEFLSVNNILLMEGYGLIEGKKSKDRGH